MLAVNDTVCGTMRKTQLLNVPNDLQQCQQMIVTMFEQMQSMQGQLDSLLRARYGMKSEAFSAGQLRLFEENEKEVVPDPKPADVETQVTGHGRKKPSKELARTEITYAVPEDQLPCPNCSQLRYVIGEERSEQYDYTPASIRVVEHIRLKRACKDCSEHVIVAEKPPSPIEKGSATAEMLAYVATSKFADHLPLNRLEGIFKRDGATISRSTMCDWMSGIASRLLPLYERMSARIRKSDVIWTDDTPVKMQDRADDRNMRNARVWVYLGDEENPYTVFDFTESRKRDGPVEFLDDFKGFLQADAFSGYDCIYAGGIVKEVACWAHARRKFFEALQTNGTACSQALQMIQDLYAIERDGRDLTPEERHAMRQAQSVPILARFKTWLDNQKVVSLPKSPLGKAVTYALNNWNALCTFTTNGALSVDNNRSERALRAMAVGRKNWLFVGSRDGGRTAAIIASMIATCKEHNIHPRIYLSDVLTRLACGEQNLDALLPDQWQCSM